MKIFARVLTKEELLAKGYKCDPDNNLTHHRSTILAKQLHILGTYQILINVERNVYYYGNDLSDFVSRGEFKIIKSKLFEVLYNEKTKKVKKK